MEELLGIGILAAVLIIVGIINMTGNISTLKKRHRKRVAPQDRKAMGKLVGTGSLVMGFSLILFGVFSFLSEKAALPYLLVIGSVILIVGFVIGLILNFYATIKYNKGLF